ncbi:hypothetical protein BDN72DRAFT_876017 [Pluteus cervinus]|uniref:Uncharacterized protein n=1 Tax=Pluteus cervinus TaxID=181527 RepID=A0ACD3B5D3_9AGAR|nr:hypothetical protein BDN72DRAFT_876017 [Pluteus cervinus]
MASRYNTQHYFSRTNHVRHSRWQGRDGHVVLSHNCLGSRYDGTPYPCVLRGTVSRDSLIPSVDGTGFEGDLVLERSASPSEARSFNATISALRRVQRTLHRDAHTVNCIRTNGNNTRVVISIIGSLQPIVFRGVDGLERDMDTFFEGFDVDVVFYLHYVRVIIGRRLRFLSMAVVVEIRLLR